MYYWITMEGAELPYTTKFQTVPHGIATDLPPLPSRFPVTPTLGENTLSGCWLWFPVDAPRIRGISGVPNWFLPSSKHFHMQMQQISSDSCLNSNWFYFEGEKTGNMWILILKGQILGQVALQVSQIIFYPIPNGFTWNWDRSTQITV